MNGIIDTNTHVHICLGCLLPTSPKHVLPNAIVNCFLVWIWISLYQLGLKLELPWMNLDSYEFERGDGKPSGERSEQGQLGTILLN